MRSRASAAAARDVNVMRGQEEEDASISVSRGSNSKEWVAPTTLEESERREHHHITGPVAVTGNNDAATATAAAVVAAAEPPRAAAAAPPPAAAAPAPSRAPSRAQVQGDLQEGCLRLLPKIMTVFPLSLSLSLSLPQACTCTQTTNPILKGKRKESRIQILT